MYEMLNKISKKDLDKYFNELSKIYRKMTHGYEVEIILIGGASILINYNFRDVTNDIDAYYLPSSEIKEAIHKVSDKFGIDTKWLNDDFKTTKSFSNKLSEFSTFYKSYNEVLSIRTIKDEYLIAMKLVSGRIYKNDISDIVGILYECKKNNKVITLETIDKAVKHLYGNWDLISSEVKNILNDALNNNDLGKMYNNIVKNEKSNKATLIDFDDKYPNILNETNINDILDKLKSK